MAYIDVAIAHAMYQRAREAGKGKKFSIQEGMVFQHKKIADLVRV
jgi:membrane protein YdbS with pleckstrin-like domain